MPVLLNAYDHSYNGSVYQKYPTTPENPAHLMAHGADTKAGLVGLLGICGGKDSHIDRQQSFFITNLIENSS